jgi:DNA-binding transcriptional LysR family regulator
VEWDDVRVLLALLRAKNLHAAGVRLGLDASTVSRRLSSVEARVGARLFVRTREGLRPTATAERLRPHAEGMEAEATAVLQAVRLGEERPSAVVRVATTDAFARILVTEGLLGVHREYPDVVVELLSGNQPVDLARGDADIALRLAALRQASLRARCVAKMGVGLFASEEYVRARGAVRGPAALGGHDVLLPVGELARLPEARWLAARADLRVAFRSNSMPALVAAAVDGHGLVPLPLGWGDSEPALRRALVLDAVPVRKLWLVTHEASSESLAVGIVSTRMASILGRIFAR